jgi:hypothetical protein
MIVVREVIGRGVAAAVGNGRVALIERAGLPRLAGPVGVGVGLVAAGIVFSDEAFAGVAVIGGDALCGLFDTSALWVVVVDRDCDGCG